MITDLSGPAFLLIDLVFVIVLGLALFIGALWWRGRRRSPAGRPAAASPEEPKRE